jgi:queuine/archaeosine tRNA-ribosyltransferase
MGAIKFIPAIGEQANNYWLSNTEYNGYDFKFFTKKSFFDYDIALQSAYYGYLQKKTGERYRDCIGFDKNKILMGDSGGFELASYKLRGESCKINVKDTLEWQEENCDIAMNLDFPPVKTIGVEMTQSDFKKSLYDSIENYKYYEKNRKNYKMKLYNVIHGDTIKQLNEWYNGVKDFNFDGWAFGTGHHNNVFVQALCMMFLYNKGEFDKKNFYGYHSFGKSGNALIPIIIYIANKLKLNFVSYDSSSFNSGSRYREYFMPFQFGANLTFGDKFINNSNIDTLPCSCPVCKIVDSVAVMNNDSFAGLLISLHNLYQYIAYNKLLVSISKSKTHFEAYLNKVNSNNTVLFECFNFVDCVLDKGFNIAVDKYAEYLNVVEYSETKQANIFNF